MSKKVPPHELQAEQSLVGAALLRQQVVETLRGYVDPSDFWNPQYGNAWAVMLDLWDQGQPIDIVTVAAAGRDHSLDPAMLAEAQNATPAVSAAQRYADLIVEASRRRKLLMHLGELSERCYTDPADSVLSDLDPGDHLIARRDGVIRGLYGLGEFVEKTQRIDDQGEWLIPHIFRPRWRTVLVAGEGVGKGTLMRSLGLHASAGRDPFNPTYRTPKRRCLYVDAENPDTTILHQIRVANQDVDLAAEADGHYWVWHREGGINLRDRRSRAEFEHVLQQTRPEIVFAGPFYKLFRRKNNEDLEQTTIEFLEVIDDFRVRFNFALMLEAHAPKGNGGYREMNPRGSAALLGWPEFGITLEPVGNPLPTETNITLDVGRFRRDREQADWPQQLFRGRLGQRIAFDGRWANGRNRMGFPY